MRKTIYVAAIVIGAAVAICLNVTAGGCGRGRPDSVRKGARTVPESPEKPPLANPAPCGAREIGSDAGLIGKLEQRILVRATLFRADARGTEECDVWLAPGTWLIPAGVFVDPPCFGRPEANHAR